MTKLLGVAWWEYSEKIKSKAFIISLVLLPAVVTALVVVPTLFVSRSETGAKHIGIVDETGLYGPALAAMLKDRLLLPDGSPGFPAEVFSQPPPGDILPVLLSIDSMVLAGRIEGYFVLSSPVGDLVEAQYRTNNPANVRLQEKIVPLLREAVMAVKLKMRGIDPGLVSEFGQSVRLRTFRISPGGVTQETAFEQTFFSVYMYMMMLFFIILTSGQLLVRSMLEEKSSRIVELLLSSVSSEELMAGKIVGLGGLGLTQMMLWGSFAYVVGRISGMAVIPLPNALLLGVYFILGYLLYAAVFVTAGAPLSTEQEAQQVTSLFSLGLIVPLGLSLPVMQDPESTLSVVLTMIPVFTPMMMAIRIPLGLPPLPEIVASLGLLGLSVILTMRLAGKVFSASVLLTGKRLSLRELRSIVKNT
ncbi:MAG TPA: ABC transporter permease [Bacteroidota bacterium]|nr:ABC transporter permease [Bacteroidota bacterium]